MATFANKSGRRYGHGGASLFVGSFNINSEDLTITAAKAWLKQAADADIVALGLQECGTVPANPFPKPTNGMARARWRSIKESSSSTHSAASTASRGSTETAGLGVTEAAVIEAFKWNSKHTRTNSESKPIASGVVVPIVEGGVSVETSCETSLDASVETIVDTTNPGVDDSVDDSGRSTGSGREELKNDCMRQESYYLRGAVDEDRDRQMLENIAECIPGRCIVADVAMGETPTHGKMKVSLSPTTCGHMSSDRRMFLSTDCNDGDKLGSLENRKSSFSGPLGNGNNDNNRRDEGFTTVEWYGTIRLLVFVRKELYRDLTVRTVVIPSGDKPSCVGDAPQDYAKDTSPDKGAVACYLSDSLAQLEVLVVNCHLFGTNKYGVEEAVFDKHRMAQLRAINTALEASLPGTATARMVLLGDLNFRVEVLSHEDDKARGGNDFQAVVQVAEEGNARSLLDLYNKSDRLRLLLARRGSSSGDNNSTSEGKGRSSDEEVPSLLWRLEDGLGAALVRDHLVRPTFTFKPGDTSNTPRRYNDKRTPSWTDRILWRGFAEQDYGRQNEPPRPQRWHHFAAVRDVISSDHEPVAASLPGAQDHEVRANAEMAAAI